MALGPFLARASFFDHLPISRLAFDVPETVETARTAGGEILSAELGARLWEGQIDFEVMTRDEWAKVRPLLDWLRGAGKAFMICDATRPFPQDDPGGIKLGAATPEIGSLPSATEMSLTGLPAGYILRRDDMLGFSYGTGPVRHALHQVVTNSAEAGAGGSTQPFEVVPPIRPGAGIGAAVELIRPVCKARIVPGSVEPPSARAQIYEGGSFRWQQTLR